MTERANRFFLGFSLIAFLFLEWDYGVYAILSILLFEGITNWRLSTIITRLRYSAAGIPPNFDENEQCKFDFEAERMLRFMVSLTIFLGFILYTEALWFLPWFVGLNLLLAGITGICPMVMIFRKIGFR